MEKPKYNMRLLVISGILALTAIFQMGYTNAYPNTAIKSFRVYMNESVTGGMTNYEFEWTWSALLAVYFVGFTIGSIVSASVMDRIGRKYTLVLGTFGSLLSAIIALFSIILHRPLFFGISRLVMSISAAISMNSLILLFQESSPSHMKGIISFNAEMAFVFTNLIGGFLGMQNILGGNLVGLIAVSIVPSAIACFLSVFLKESPKYLYITKNDFEGAGHAIQFYLNIDGGEEKALFLADLKKERDQTLNERRITFFDLIKIQPYRRGFLLGIAAMQLTVSVWPVVFYSTEFLMDAGWSYSTSETVSTVMLFISTLSTFVGMIVVEKFPRKHLVLITGFINVSALTLLAVCSILSPQHAYIKYGCVIFLVMHGMSYSLGMGPIGWFITSELLPINCRAIAQSLVLGINHSLALLLTFLSFPLYKLYGPIILILFFALPGFVCLGFLVKYLPETKDRHINQIVEDLTEDVNQRRQDYELENQ